MRRSEEQGSEGVGVLREGDGRSEGVRGNGVVTAHLCSVLTRNMMFNITTTAAKNCSGYWIAGEGKETIN